jgi:hypothetical protein
MPRTAASIINAAQQIARTPAYGSQALDEFNSLLRYVEETVDFSSARGQWNFFFNTNLVNSGAGNIIQTAGVPIPIDYLRVQVSGGSTGAQRSSKWYFQGVPYDMVEVDLTEFDDQVQQAGIQSYPYFWTLDLAQYQPIIEIIGDLNISSGGGGLTGGGQQLTGGGQTLTGGGSGAAAGTVTITNILPIDVGKVLSQITVGMSIAGGIGPISALVPGSIISAISGSGATLTLTIIGLQPPNSSSSPGTGTLLTGGGQQLTGGGVDLTGGGTGGGGGGGGGSPAATVPMTGATFLIGNPGLGLMYPPPSGAYPAMIRYQRRMPRLTQAQVNGGAYPWLSDADMALEWGLTGLLMRYADDQRENIYIGSGIGSGQGQFGQWLGKYLRLADDNAKRAQTVQLDRRVFGRSFSNLKNTKTVGW